MKTKPKKSSLAETCKTILTALAVFAMTMTALIAIKACKPDSVAPQPKPSVAQLEVLRSPVEIMSKDGGGEARAPATDARLEPGAVVSTGETGRAILKLDLGASILMDRSARVRLTPGGIQLEKGRVYVDAVSEIEVLTPGGRLRSLKSGFDVETRKTTTRVYCAAGEVSYPPEPGDQDSETPMKSISSGMTVVLQPSGAQLLPEALWEDWTSGFARVGPKRSHQTAGIGRLEGRQPGALGETPTPLINRRHEVSVEIRGDMALTKVTQTFFNPHSHNVSGYYEVLLPSGAIISSFSAGPTDNIVPASIHSRFRDETRHNPAVLLEWAGDNLYKGHINDIERGSSYTIELSYIQWLKHRDGRRVYIYPMGGGDAPRLGEFVLEVNLEKTEAHATQASLGARREGSRVVLSKSDYEPPADFVLELLDSEKKNPAAKVYKTAGSGENKDGTLYMVIPPPLPDPPESLKVVIVADLSSGLSPTQVKLAADSVDSVLQQLSATDKVAVLASDLDIHYLGEEKRLAIATSEYREQIIDALARHRIGGASDIGMALEKAAQMLPQGQGAIVYIGAGRPSTGILVPGPIKDRLARRGVFPRLFAIGVGTNADRAFLEALTVEGGFTRIVEDREEGAGAVFQILAEASRPSLAAVTVDTGGVLERVYPSRPFALTAGEQIRISAWNRGKIPSRVTVKALANGRPVKAEFETQVFNVVDEGDLERRWAAARIRNLLEEGAGREAVADLAVRHGILTPWTALAINAYQGYKSLLPYPAPESFSVEDFQTRGNAPPTDGRMSLAPDWLSRTTQSKPSWERLYRDALRTREAPIRLCFERKAAGRPELSGRVDLRFELRADGSVKTVEKIYTSLRDDEVEACMLRAAGALTLPAPPPGAPAVFTYTFRLQSPDGHTGGFVECSAASRQYLARRRILWRERLSRARTLGETMNVWREAYRQCELRTWLDRRAMLDLMLNSLRTVREGIRLYHEFHFNPPLQSYLRREILRRIRTRDDIEAAGQGLNLEGLVDWELLNKGLEKARHIGDKIKLVEDFIALAPESLRLQTILLNLFEKAKRHPEAAELAYQLRRNPAADMEVKRLAGEYLVRRGQMEEARRAFSEIVDSAPFDPWARRYLGHVYFAHDWCKEAYQQYKTLAWLTPQDQTVDLTLAQAAACTGSIDEALRLLDAVSESDEAGPGRTGPAAAARVLTSILLARLKKESRENNDQERLLLLNGRSRRLGVLTWAGDLMIAVLWKNRQAPLRVTVIEPGEEEAKPFPLVFQDAGLAALRRKKMQSGKYIVQASLASKDPARQAAYKAKLILLHDEASENETIIEKKLVFPPGTDALAFEIKGREINEVKPKEEKQEPRERQKRGR